MGLELDGKQDGEDYFVKHPSDTTRRVGSAREPEQADAVAGHVYWEEERLDGITWEIQDLQFRMMNLYPSSRK